MSYRPITDIWLLARPKVRYYGAYSAGFPERARALLGATIDEPVLHVCGGRAKEYPYRGGFGPLDKTVDADFSLAPDFVLNVATDSLPQGFKAHLIDPPYSHEHAEHYAPGALNYPDPRELLGRSLDALRVGQRTGLIHFLMPRPPNGTRLVALIGVAVGYQNRIRAFLVYEKR